jgi:hypothetical protein
VIQAAFQIVSSNPARQTDHKQPLQFLIMCQHPVYNSATSLIDPSQSTYFQERSMPVADKRSLMISGGWIQAAAIVLIIGFLIM